MGICARKPARRKALFVSGYFITIARPRIIRYKEEMTKQIFIILTILIIVVSCNSGQQKEGKVSTDSSVVIRKATVPETKLETTEIICDSLYPNNSYKLTLLTFAPSSEDETIPNTLFIFSKLTNGQYLPIISDSIFSMIHKVRFEDYNNDKLKDILVQNYSDVRGNWSYHLYIVDTVENKLKKIRGFETIKNPNYLPTYDLIDNYVMSGEIWTSFYKITGDTIKDLDIVIYDNQRDDGSYEREHKQAIQAILKKGKNSH